MVHCLSSIIIGDTLELRLSRQVPATRTYQKFEPETRRQRWLRRLLRRPRPSHQVSYEFHDFEDTGRVFLLTATEEGVEMTEMPKESA